MRNPLKLAGVTQTKEAISVASRPVHHIVRTCGGNIAVQQVFFPIVDTCLSCEDIARQGCVMVRRWQIFFCDFLGPAFPASHVQHISDLHSKFVLGPHHV